MLEMCAANSAPQTLEKPTSRSPAVVATEPRNWIPPSGAASKITRRGCGGGGTVKGRGAGGSTITGPGGAFWERAVDANSKTEIVHNRVVTRCMLAIGRFIRGAKSSRTDHLAMEQPFGNRSYARESGACGFVATVPIRRVMGLLRASGGLGAAAELPPSTPPSFVQTRHRVQ